MASYATWYAIAVAGSANENLAAITDAAYVGDPAGTDCDSTYWEGRAYDQIRALYVAIGSNPGLGVDGNFTINQDNASNDAEDATLNFDRGTAVGGDATIRWDSSETYFLLNQTLTSNSNIGTTAVPIPKVWATNIDIAATLDGLDADFTGDLGVDGTATIATLDVTGTATINGLNLAGNITTEGTLLTFNSDEAGTPTENVALVVERGTEVNAILRWTENGDDTSLWEAYNHGNAAYESVVLLGASGVSTAGFFDDTGISTPGTALYPARNDHNHSGGSLNATGTDETSWNIDEDYVSGSVSIELRFGTSSNYIRFNPGGNANYEFSSSVSSNANNTDDLGTASLKWRDLRLGRDAYIDGDLTLAGSVLGSLTQTGQLFTFETNASARTVDADIIADRGTNGSAKFRWDESETKWTFANDGSTFTYLVGANLSTDLWTAPGDLAVTGDITGNLTLTGTTHTLGSIGSSLLLQVPTTGFAGKLQYTTGTSVWQIDHGTGTLRTIATLNGTEAFSSKTISSSTLVAPTINTGGSWSGDPTFSGNPSFSGNPTFTGNPNFTADTDSRPVFTTTAGQAPFTISLVGVGATNTITDLDADYLDGLHATNFLRRNGSLAMTGNLDMGGFSITNVSGSAHQSSHLSGGGDALAGALGEVTGVTSTVFTVNSDGSSATGTELSLGGGEFYVKIVDNAAGYLGLGGSNIDAVPGSASGNQDIGNANRRWRAGYLNHFLNINLQGSVPSGISDGSLWLQSGSPQKLNVYLNSATKTVIDSNGKTGAVGTTGNWSVDGNLTVSGSSPFSASGHDHSGVYANSSHTHAAGDVTSGKLAIIRGGTNNDAYTAGQFVYYDTPSDSLISSGFSSASFSGSGHDHSGVYANSSHTHSTSDLTSGTLAVNRGGTGNTSYTNGEFLSFNSGSTIFQSSGYSSASFSLSGHNHDGSYSSTSHNHDSSYANLSGDTFTGEVIFNGGMALQSGDLFRFEGSGSDSYMYYSAGKVYVVVDGSISGYFTAGSFHDGP